MHKSPLSCLNSPPHSAHCARHALPYALHGNARWNGISDSASPRDLAPPRARVLRSSHLPRHARKLRASMRTTVWVSDGASPQSQAEAPESAAVSVPPGSLCGLCLAVPVPSTRPSVRARLRAETAPSTPHSPRPHRRTAPLSNSPLSERGGRGGNPPPPRILMARRRPWARHGRRRRP